eukprot:TRINITY_DN220_c0_g1_i5.p1 TRINITY_DN220_c0_g1~~TRINITY_DN220_c0_g1_i5.p1  ORF type:complete len:431 (+),score=53.42 TRINITY_DN220_c0_g1_i5:76-1293(+)
MCTALRLCILNGLCNGDHNGRYTYISDHGSSVNDYFLASLSLFQYAYDHMTFDILDRIESDHLPILLCFDRLDNSCSTSKTSNVVEEQFVVKYRWASLHANKFSNSMSTRKVKEDIDAATNLIDVDISLAINRFNQIVRDQALYMEKRICIGKQPHKEWFDNECRLKRRKVRRLLRKYKHSVDKDDRVLYCIERREYKNMLARKKTKHRELLLTELLNSVKCQKTFWEIIRKVSRKKTQPQNSISIDQWFEHFKRVLEKEADDSIEEDTEEDVDEEEEFLDRPISREEVMLAIKKLKNGKAAGPDRLIGEFFKHSCDSTLTFLVKLFNYLFDNGIYPENWTESIILPLFKKGDANDTNNYRGVSLCNISSKLYSSIINNRLQEWVNMNNITGEHQAGFKKKGIVQ